ncbi:MAG: hypothetical protein OEV91_00505 [Desulfobulbaceae bacterium]|nr:hypothetical protein [Desulfobulbaceae bacterium]
MEESPQIESRLLPILREAVEVVKMILFKELKEDLAARYPARAGEAGRVAGAVLNDFFGVVNPEPAVVAFVAENRGFIDTVIADFPSRFANLLIPLTDGLRMQFLCDSREGVDDTDFLARAKERGLLADDREMPLPHHFLHLVRRLGSTYGLVLPPLPPEENSPSH